MLLQLSNICWESVYSTLYTIYSYTLHYHIFHTSFYGSINRFIALLFIRNISHDKDKIFLMISSPVHAYSTHIYGDMHLHVYITVWKWVLSKCYVKQISQCVCLLLFFVLFLFCVANRKLKCRCKCMRIWNVLSLLQQIQRNITAGLIMTYK